MLLRVAFVSAINKQPLGDTIHRCLKRYIVSIKCFEVECQTSFEQGKYNVHEERSTALQANLMLQCHQLFLLFLIQHHCRKCGGVVCSNCSTKKFLLPSQSSKPLRVCDNCYNVLSSGKVLPDQEPKRHNSMLIFINFSPS